MSHVFPGRGGPPVDDRIVAPESRAEIVEGSLFFSPPADERHAVPHADLAYVLRAHVNPGFNVAVDMLTRTSKVSDFAPAASVYEAERDPETGGRRLERLAFEIVNEQPLSTQTTKARELAKRGVGRIFCLVTKHRRLLEWSGETDAWSAAPVESIDDPCFVRPLPANALLDGPTADTAVVRALRAKGRPEFDAGREEGREEGLRTGIRDLCESLGVELTTARGAALASMSSTQLDALRLALKRDRRWPL
jgi:hypothetical protein